MNTITAKELRDNMDEIVKRVRRGETIHVTYRSKPAFTLQPEIAEIGQPEPGSPEAMEAFLRMTEVANKMPRESQLDPSKSVNDPQHKGYHV